MTEDNTLTPNKYQEKALSTCTDSSRNIPYMVTGLASEALEVLQKVYMSPSTTTLLIDMNVNHLETELSYFKKNIRDNGEEPPTATYHRDEIAKEIGDVLWYIASLAHLVGYTLEEIMEMNIAKLSSRKERGVIGGSGDER